jgi:xanthine dehydrogenase YagS FAD-binding subunit
MHPFTLERPRDLIAALAFGAEAGRNDATAEYIAGGTDMVQLLQEFVRRPDRLVSLAGLVEDGIELGPQGLRLGAAATMAEVAAHPAVVEQFPVISEALLNSASPQVRNQATMGGNLLQRTRCPYFRDVGYEACNKRAPGSGCAAIGGENRWHAVLGTSDNCIAAHPSDLAVALVALDAAVEVLGPSSRRTVPLADLHRLPGDTPHIETVLEAGEIIAAITVPANPAARRSHYLKCATGLPSSSRSCRQRLRSRWMAAAFDRPAWPSVGSERSPGGSTASKQPSPGLALIPMHSGQPQLLRPKAHRAAVTTASRSNSCSAPSCVPSKSREPDHEYRSDRTTCQPRRRPPEGHRRGHLCRRILRARRGARRHRA